MVEEFERAFAAFTGTAHAVAVCNGTAALHAAMAALGIGPGDEVIVPAITFVATANAVVYQGGTPVFADVDPDTLLIDPEAVRRLITQRTSATAAVDYAGQPCDYPALRANTANITPLSWQTPVMRSGAPIKAARWARWPTSAPSACIRSSRSRRARVG